MPDVDYQYIIPTVDSNGKRSTESRFSLLVECFLILTVYVSSEYDTNEKLRVKLTMSVEGTDSKLSVVQNDVTLSTSSMDCVVTVENQIFEWNLLYTGIQGTRIAKNRFSTDSGRFPQPHC